MAVEGHSNITSSMLLSRYRATGIHGAVEPTLIIGSAIICISYYVGGGRGLVVSLATPSLSGEREREGVAGSRD
jgi:hypothetical protein